MISLIVAHAKNFVIGDKGKMPWHLPADLQHFKSSTMGHPVIMGRKTFQSIGRALPGRKNIVVSRNKDLELPFGVDRADSLADALEMLVGVDEVFVIGGGMLYREALPLAQRLYLTLIDADIAGDTSFPQYDASSYREIYRSFYPRDEKNQYDLTFLTLERIES